MNFPQMKTFLQDTAQNNTDFVTLQLIGHTAGGLEIMALKLANQKADDKLKASVALIGGLDVGDVVGGEIIVRIIRHLVKGLFMFYF